MGRNRRVQDGSVIRHGETDCLENAGRLTARTYRASVLYTTLSPCLMCAGSVLLYQIPRIVVGENRTFESSEALLRSRGVQVDVLDDSECRELMARLLRRSRASGTRTSGWSRRRLVDHGLGRPCRRRRPPRVR